MSGRVKHKSRDSEGSSIGHKKKKSQRHSSSASDDCAIVNARKNVCSKEKRQRSEKSKRRGSCFDSSSPSDSSLHRLMSVDSSRQLVGECPEFCRNGGNQDEKSLAKDDTQRALKSKNNRSEERAINAQLKERFEMLERRVPHTAVNEKHSARKRAAEDLDKRSIVTKKWKKSQKRRRSSSRSSSSGNSSTSSSDSSSYSGRTSSTGSSRSHEKRRKRKKRKKKLAKKMKREEKRRKNERRKMKKIKEKFKESVNEMKHGVTKTEQDRLLKDINVELADRARAMAPMTREQWEKKQNVVRRVYDEETGRHRLIKGDGEVLEEIVSRDRHMEINRNATKGDGAFFQSRLGVNK